MPIIATIPMMMVVVTTFAGGDDDDDDDGVADCGCCCLCLIIVHAVRFSPRVVYLPFYLLGGAAGDTTTNSIVLFITYIIYWEAAIDPI